jgi:Transposase
VPGRKTDTRDCEWIADLLQHGLLKGSFVPPTPIQDLRDLTRYRAELRQSQNRVANRIQKFLEQANLKLSSVASDALGISGRRMLEAIIGGQDDPQQLAQLARGKLKRRIPQLEQALAGRVRDHHRFLLAEYLDEWKALEERIQRIEAAIDRRIVPFEEAVALWQTYPGPLLPYCWAEYETRQGRLPTRPWSPSRRPGTLCGSAHRGCCWRCTANHRNRGFETQAGRHSELPMKLLRVPHIAATGRPQLSLPQPGASESQRRP